MKGATTVRTAASARQGARSVPPKTRGGFALHPRVAQEEWRYDEHGEATEHRFYDEGGHSLRGPTASPFLYRRDEGGSNLAEVRYQDPAGQPTLHREGMASRRYRYDEHGNEIEWAYFDSDGKPTLNNSALPAGALSLMNAATKRRRRILIQKANRPGTKMALLLCA